MKEMVQEIEEQCRFRSYNVEKTVGKRLGEMYGTQFRKRKLIIGNKSNGEPQIHEFDLVSEDRNIVGEVKSGMCSRTNYNLALVDCLYLSKIKADLKLMVFTDKKLYDYFRDKSPGLVSEKIQPILVSI